MSTELPEGEIKGPAEGEPQPASQAGRGQAGAAARREAARVQVVGYGPDGFQEFSVEDPQELHDYLGRWPVLWVNVEGVRDLNLIAGVGEVFALHHLALEDVSNVHQRAKVELYDHHQFIVLRMVNLKEALETEQLGLFLGKDFVVTFQEEEAPGDPFDRVRERIRINRGSIRSCGADYLMYSLVDAVVDAYFPILEDYGEQLEDLEDEMLTNPTRNCVGKIHKIKRNLLTLRRAIWPLRDALNSLYRDPMPLIMDNTRIYLRDCYDHSIRIIDLLETDRELCSDLMDVYLSSVSNRLNEVMTWLTMISAIFIPPTFIVGVYGMNFNTAVSPWNMPELNWYYGYLFSWLLIVCGMLLFPLLFWFKGWLRLPPRDKCAGEEQRAGE
ncbi:MAG TPA: magnesium/cobalt transporter CorA [Candidatus Obscuribacterales bacterium]